MASPRRGVASERSVMPCAAEAVSFLHSSELFASMPESDKRRLACCLRVFRFREGEVVFRDPRAEGLDGAPLARSVCVAAQRIGGLAMWEAGVVPPDPVPHAVRALVRGGNARADVNEARTRLLSESVASSALLRSGDRGSVARAKGPLGLLADRQVAFVIKGRCQRMGWAFDRAEACVALPTTRLPASRPLTPPNYPILPNLPTGTAPCGWCAAQRRRWRRGTWWGTLQCSRRKSRWAAWRRALLLS